MGCGFECLYCNFKAKRFPSLVSVRQHIFDKGHNKIDLKADKLMEFSDFYDYSSSYPDAGKTPAEVVLGKFCYSWGVHHIRFY